MRITGTAFAPGATVFFGGTPANPVDFESATVLWANSPAHAAGLVAVTVTVNGQSGSLPNAFTYTTPQQPQIFDYFDGASQTSLAGWACDSSDFARPIQVHIYATNLSSEGCLLEFDQPICFVGAVLADVDRPDVAGVCGGYSQHGFAIPTPAVLRDGREHRVHAFAISLAGPSIQLANSPLWPTHWALEYSRHDSRRSLSTGDWSPQNYKAECDVAEPMVGLSMVTFSRVGHAALCRAGVPAERYPHDPNRCWPLDFSSGDRRFADTGDWDPGYYKGECGPDQYVAGISQAASRLTTQDILCCDGLVNHNSCSARVLDSSDSRETESSGDWDPWFWKVECGEGRYLGGVSRHPITGSPHAVLCCSP